MSDNTSGGTQSVRWSAEIEYEQIREELRLLTAELNRTAELLEQKEDSMIVFSERSQGSTTKVEVRNYLSYEDLLHEFQRFAVLIGFNEGVVYASPDSLYVPGTPTPEDALQNVPDHWLADYIADEDIPDEITPDECSFGCPCCVCCEPKHVGEGLGEEG